MSDSRASTQEAAQAKACVSSWQGLPAVSLTLANGDSALIALQGAQVLSWVCNGQEQLFTSPLAAHDGHTPIRGGIPVCFPQFNQRGPLVKHGFGRTMAWAADASEAEACEDGGLQFTLSLTDSEATRAVWPHEFEAQITVSLTPSELHVQLGVHNRGAQPLSFTAALHSYLRVPQIEQVQLCGLEAQRYWDAVVDTYPTQAGALQFGAELDRVYPRAAQPLQLQMRDAVATPLLQIAQDEAWSETVVWNPGPQLCAKLADMEPQSYEHMLCVEAAAIDAPVLLAAGQRWQAAQTLTRL